jgi:hypothetical protein
MALCLVVIMVLAAMAGLLALVGVAVVSARPALFLATGLVAFLVATTAGVGITTRNLRPAWPDPPGHLRGCGGGWGCGIYGNGAGAAGRPAPAAGPRGRPAVLGAAGRPAGPHDGR